MTCMNGQSPRRYLSFPSFVHFVRVAEYRQLPCVIPLPPRFAYITITPHAESGHFHLD